ncbi:MAG: hypothetical protein LBT23_00620, partial [Synergistaceae bacterium]|nr:hypothetical protein [Synergistaceae bacterium]
EGTFLLEDISGDFEMAEELVWWAAVGRAFFHRLEENGAVIRRVSPYEDPPATAAEIIPCSWEGEHLGSLAIELPGEMMAEAPPDDDAAPKSAGPGDRHVKEITPPREARHDMESEEAPMNPELDESKGNSGNIAKLNKNAARKAYGGGASRRPASSDEQKS